MRIPKLKEINEERKNKLILDVFTEPNSCSLHEFNPHRWECLSFADLQAYKCHDDKLSLIIALREPFRDYYQSDMEDVWENPESEFWVKETFSGVNFLEKEIRGNINTYNTYTKINYMINKKNKTFQFYSNCLDPFNERREACDNHINLTKDIEDFEIYFNFSYKNYKYEIIGEVSEWLGETLTHSLRNKKKDWDPIFKNL